MLMCDRNSNCSSVVGHNETTSLYSTLPNPSDYNRNVVSYFKMASINYFMQIQTLRRNGTGPAVIHVSGSNDTTTAETAHCRFYEMIIYTCVSGLLCLFGLVGNSLTVVALWPDRKQSATVFLLISLAAVDSMVLMSWTAIPAFVAYARYTESFAQMYSVLPYVLVDVYPVCSVNHTATTWVTVTVALHRYIAVCRPYQMKRYGTRRLAKLQLILILILSVLFNLPRFFQYSVVRHSRDSIIIEELLAGDLYNQLYLIGAYQVVMYVVPLTILVVLTRQLVLGLRANKSRRNEMKMASASRLHADLTFSLVVLVCIFLICQTFNPVRRVLETTLTDDWQECGTAYFYYTPLVVVAVNFNSSINFVIYVICGKRFRMNVLQLFRSKNVVQPVM